MQKHRGGSAGCHMPRESAHDKGRRLLTEGRLDIRFADGRTVTARCRGDSAEIYNLGFDRDWFCTCPAAARCSHLVALQLVTLKPLPTQGTGKERERYEQPPRIA